MQLQQVQEQSQKLILTQTMRQSLKCLQMSAPELSGYLQEAALSNPLLEVEQAPLSDFHLDTAAQHEQAERAEAEQEIPIARSERSIWNDGRSGGGISPESSDFTAFFSRPQSFSEYLNDQLDLMTGLDGETLALSKYLVGCLNSAGYLDCALAELARELSVSPFQMEQALFVVQSLDPPGVGARSLSECLLVQLAQGREFTEVNIHLIRSGLPLLAKNDCQGLCRLLGVRAAEVQRAAQVIRSLNPIPSRGFYSGGEAAYVVPEAQIHCDREQVFVEMNDRGLPKVSLNPEYCALLGDQPHQEAQPYLKEKLAEARELLSVVQNRRDTLFRLLSAVIQRQREYFLHGGDLQPMTMRQLAEELEVSTSTVSRAIREKYVQFNGRSLSLRSLFTASLQSTDGQQSVSAEAARRQIKRFIAAEDPGRPLSDEALGEALSGVGIALSRRTVAKYRGELGLPSAAARKRNAQA